MLPFTGMTENSNSLATSALRDAQARLSMWRGRVDDVQRFYEELEPEERQATSPFVRALRDRCEHAEIALLRLQQMERGWREARSRVVTGFGELDEAWRAVNHVLSPTESCSHAWQPSWPY